MSKSRDAVEDIRTIDTVTATANAALPKAGGALTGAVTTNSTFDGRDVSADVATTNTALALKAPIASPVFTGNVEVYGASTPKLTVKSGDGTSASIKLQRVNENDASTDFEIKNNGGTFEIRGDNTSQNEFPLIKSTTTQHQFFTNNTERMRIDSSGNVLLGGKTGSNFAVAGTELRGVVSDFIRDSNPAINVNRLSTGGSTIAFHRSGTPVGTISVSTSATSYNTSSDYRLKTDVQPMTGATDRVKLLKPCNFEWIVDGTRVDGFLAHEAEEVVPEAVSGTKDAMRDEEYEVTAATDTEAAVMGTRSVPDLQGIDQSKLVPLLTATIQELIARIEALEA